MAKPARRVKRRARTSAAAKAAPAAKAVPESDAALAAFAHDIRTALTGILALGELLSSSNLGERERRWAAGIKGSAEHLAALTTLAIDAAKAEAGGIVLRQERFPAGRADRGGGAIADRPRRNQGIRRRGERRRTSCRNF